MTEKLTRPIIGIENRTAQEVFDMMCDRIRRTPAPEGEVVGDPVLWKDRPDEWTDAILAAHPVNSTDPERHNRFALAMKMVGNRHGKYELVGLVHWLLTRLDAASPVVPVARAGISREWLIEIGRTSSIDSVRQAKCWLNAKPLR